MPRSHHRNSRLRQHFWIPANIKHQRRIVYFFQPRRIAGILPGNNGHNVGIKSSARIKIGMRRLRISAISYLNTAPLMWDFEHGEAGADFDISYTLPSGCARALAAGNADIGIIPAAAFAQIPGLMVIPGIAIASRQPVRSILLVSRVPVEKIRTVALDTSSMTSVALTKILFEKWLGGG